MKYAWAPVLVLGIALGACASPVRDHSPSHQNRLKIVSLCSLVGPNAPASGTEVRIDTFFITDYMERSRLADPACLSGHVDFEFKADAIGPQGGNAYNELESALLHDLATDHRTGVYSIDLAGRFVYRKDKHPHAMIDIDRVWSFKQLPCAAFYPAAECKVQ